MAARPQERPSGLRERIIDAAFEVIREHGMARARTSAIAEAAGCAEGSIYRYFSGKPQLMEEVVRSRLPDVAAVLDALPGRAGTATVRANLLGLSRSVLGLYAEIVPLAAGVLADADLRAEQQRLFGGAELGTREAAALAAYLRAEQDRGRVRAAADPEAAACLLIRSCLGASLSGALAGREAGAEAAVEAMLVGLEPEPGQPAGGAGEDAP
jgi:AcrR family transcriptional regulator